MSEILCPNCGHGDVVATGPVATRPGPRALGGLGPRRTRRVAPLRCSSCGLRWVEEVPRGFDPGTGAA